MPDWENIRYEIERYWQLLALRQRINANPGIVIGITITTALILLVVIIGLLTPDKPPKSEIVKKAWFYDLNTGRLFTAKYNAAAPLKAPSGPLPNGKPAGVKAYVLTYVDEPNESQRFIAFLETADPNAGKPGAPDAGPGIDRSGLLIQGKLIRTIEDANWAPADSPKGRSIIKETFRPNKKGRYPRYYLPK